MPVASRLHASGFNHGGIMSFVDLAKALDSFLSF